jgi:DNA-binding response OmpR family regulator
MPASILIADSSSSMRALIERAISVAGLPVSRCLQARDAGQALRLIESRSIDFLLLDTHLGGIDQKKLLEALDPRGEATAVPFMVTSSDASSARIQRLLEAGARDYLLKPFSIPTLCARLDTALRTVHANH